MLESNGRLRERIQRTVQGEESLENRRKQIQAMTDKTIASDGQSHLQTTIETGVRATANGLLRRTLGTLPAGDIDNVLQWETLTPGRAGGIDIQDLP